MTHNPKAVEAMATELFESGMSPKLNKALAKRTLDQLAHLGFVLMPIEPTIEITSKMVSHVDRKIADCPSSNDIRSLYTTAIQAYHNTKQ